MNQTAAGALLFCRFIERRQQKGQEHHIVIQGHPAGQRGPRPNGPADAAVAAQVPFPLLWAQLLGVCHYISKHGTGLLLVIVPCYRPVVNRKLIF